MEHELRKVGTRHTRAPRPPLPLPCHPHFMEDAFHRKRGKFKPSSVGESGRTVASHGDLTFASATPPRFCHNLSLPHRHNRCFPPGIWRSQNSLEDRGNIERHGGRRPIIGLALGGGAARGFAHIGIVRTLIAKGIVPHVVVGTSIGAVVGGAYATGHLDTLEAWARRLQPRNVLSYLDLKLNGSGLIGGDKLAAELEAAIGQTLIEDLPLKFATVATEVRTGHETWLTHGRVVDAMRASYALPGIFSPVLAGERWLVDGALVNPVPVSAARALGAEIVIAANLSSDIFTHSTTIYSHGASAVAQETATERPSPRRGLGKFFSAERAVKREFFGGGGRPGIS